MRCDLLKNFEVPSSKCVKNELQNFEMTTSI